MQIWSAGQIKLVRLLLLFAILLSACDRIYFPPGPGDEKWSFVVFGDTRLGYDIVARLSQNIAHIKPVPHAAFCLGDIVNNSTDEDEWLRFSDSAKPITLKMPLFYARGNHDGNDTVSEKFFRQLSGITSDTFYYAFSEENTLLIILDTYERGKESAVIGDQLNWLQNQLDSASADTSIWNIFIFMHHPLYPQGKHSGENLVNADDLHQLFLKHQKIRAVFSGHDHIFNKYVKDGMVYITTGGGGAPLYPGYGGDYHHFVKVSFYEDSTRINIKTIGISNEVFDDFDL
jgi:3',5'-cyclic AMP phosphodiesterase CpdA